MDVCEPQLHCRAKSMVYFQKTIPSSRSVLFLVQGGKSELHRFFLKQGAGGVCIMQIKPGRSDLTNRATET